MTQLHESDPQSQQLLTLAQQPGAFLILSAELRAALNYAGWFPIGEPHVRPEQVAELLSRVIGRLTDHIAFGEDFALGLTPRRK